MVGANPGGFNRNSAAAIRRSIALLIGVDPFLDCSQAVFQIGGFALVAMRGYVAKIITPNNRETAMGFRFRRSVRLFPGFRVNLSKSGASVSIGPRGFKYTVGPKGTRVTAGIPGTGLSWTEYTPHSKQPSISSPEASPGLVEPVAFEPALPVIQSAPVEQINQLSTSELAPILNSAQGRVRFAPGVLIASVLLWLVALFFGNQFLMGLMALHTTIFVPCAIYLDRYRRSVKIEYSLDETAGKIASALAEAFADLKNCGHLEK